MGFEIFRTQAEINRSYMKAIRALLNIGQYHIARDMKRSDLGIIRESTVSMIEGRIGNMEQADDYYAHINRLIERSEQSESVKEIMRMLLKEWRES